MTRSIAREITTDPIYIPGNALYNENWMGTIPPHFFFTIKDQHIKIQFDLLDYIKKVASNIEEELAYRLMAKLLYLGTLDDNIHQTETIYNEKQEELPKYKPSNVIVSKQFATKLRANKVTALIPVSATDLIWLEALSMDDDLDE